MAGTAGSGGLGALTVGGIATVAVVVGGVVLMQLGVFSSDPPIDEQANTNGQVEATVATAVEPTKGDAPETAVTVKESAPAAAVEQIATETSADDAQDVAQPPSEQAAPEQSEATAEAQQDTVVADVADTPVAESTEPVADASTTTQDQVDQTVETANVDEPAAAEETETQEQAQPTQTAALALPDTTDPAVDEEPSFVLMAPELDLVRFDTDGSGVIAGRAQAGVQISVLLDDKVLDQFMVQNGGEFVSLTSIEPSIDARVVSLVAAFDGQTAMSDATFILAPSQTSATATEEPAEPPKEVVVVAEETTVTEQVEQPQATQDVVDEVVAADASQVAVVESEDVAETQVEAAADPEVAVADEPVAAEAETAPETVAALADTSDETEATEAAVEVAKTAAPQPVTQPETETETEVQPTPTPVAVLKADSKGVELVQPATPVAPELLGKVALDTISYSEEGDVQLAGRAQPDSLVRVYLDNSPVADIRAAENGRWRGELSDIAPGIYTLRLDELDAEGVVLSRLETPFKRESPEALQPPAAPEDSPTQAAPLIRAVTVQKGDTLWAISRERYGDGLLYVRVFEANKGDIRNPDLIYPGQVFNIPE